MATFVPMADQEGSCLQGLPRYPNVRAKPTYLLFPLKGPDNAVQCHYNTVGKNYNTPVMAVLLE